MTVLMEVKDLVTRFKTHEGVVHAVNGVSYTLDEGETLGVVGESGSGKSVQSLAIMGLIPSPPGIIESGTVMFRGRDLLKLSREEMRMVRGAEIAMIFQDPMTSLNPVLTIGRQITEALKLHLGMDNEQSRERAAELLSMVGIPMAAQRLDSYPHQFSGGMRQRAMIAMALSCNPQLLIADEPTTALDVTIQAQILDLVKRLRDKIGMAMIWISHDLGVVAGLADTVQVMYAGFIVERGPVSDVFNDYAPPLHARPEGSASTHRRQTNAPDLYRRCAAGYAQKTCRSARLRRAASIAIDKCWTENPPLRPVTDGKPTHIAACWVDVRKGTRSYGRSAEQQWLISQQSTNCRINATGKNRSCRYAASKSTSRSHRASCFSAKWVTSKPSMASALTCTRAKRSAWSAKSGCGKSTTGRTVLQLYRPTAGTVSFEGVDISQHARRIAAKNAPPDANDLPRPLCLAQSADVRRAYHRGAVGRA